MPSAWFSRGTVLVAAVTALLAAWPVSASAQSTARQDALIGSYFAIWDDDSQVTMENVQRLYAAEVLYYGHRLSRDGVFADKRAFIRRWPDRHYAVEPGSAQRDCDASESHCVLRATLLWQTHGARGARSGRWRIALRLAQSDGGLKIVEENGTRLPR